MKDTCNFRDVVRHKHLKRTLSIKLPPPDYQIITMISVLDSSYSSPPPADIVIEPPKPDPILLCSGGVSHSNLYDFEHNYYYESITVDKDEPVGVEGSPRSVMGLPPLKVSCRNGKSVSIGMLREEQPVSSACAFTLLGDTFLSFIALSHSSLLPARTTT